MVPKLLLILILSGLFAISYTQYANSEFLSDFSYQLSGTGFAATDKQIEDSKIDLEFSFVKDTSNKNTMIVKNGVTNLSGKDYTLSENWKISSLQQDRLLELSGDAKNSDGDKISFYLLGTLVGSNNDGSVYTFIGTIKKSNQFIKSIYTTKISKIIPVEQLPSEEKTTPTIPPTTETKETNKEIVKLALIAKQTSPIQVSYSYQITTKVYDANKNPTKDFNQDSGFVQGAKITAKIIGSDGIVVKTLEGTTDSHGYYSDGFRIPDNFKPGTYKVVVTAEKNGMTDSNELTLHVEQFYIQ
ncbi:MAG: hypothetical protein HY295_06490 [Thaumarchaeota archaeon]|nr:hypothetical protein [Nitrososphaerota archaeon]